MAHRHSRCLLCWTVLLAAMLLLSSCALRPVATPIPELRAGVTLAPAAETGTGASIDAPTVAPGYPLPIAYPSPDASATPYPAPTESDEGGATGVSLPHVEGSHDTPMAQPAPTMTPGAYVPPRVPTAGTLAVPHYPSPQGGDISRHTTVAAPTVGLPRSALAVLPTATPCLDGDLVCVATLPMGEPGQLINLTLGYRTTYPADWYSDVSGRPLRVSISSLDPADHSRADIKAEGCLIEVKALVNYYAEGLAGLRAQLPKAFVGALGFELDGVQAWRVPGLDRETVYVSQGKHLLVLTYESASGAAEACQAAWEELLSTWRWTEPELGLYTNSEHGYAVAFPREWYAFNPTDSGVFISSIDPKENLASGDGLDLARQGMLIIVKVHENAEGFSLREWVASVNRGAFLVEDIVLGEPLGVRVVRRGPTSGLEESTGYYRGRLGGIIQVACLYPQDRGAEFRPIANAVLFGVRL